MSDAPREEEIYQALAPGSSYKSGLVNPVAAQQETTVSVPMRFKGAMGGQAVGNDDYPDHEPRASVPYKHYKDLEDVDPTLHEAVTHVADQMKIPRTDLASLVYANSDYNPNARDGARTGYMGLTPDDARNLDPEGHLDINDPIDNLFLGAMKYKRMANRFGMGTPVAFAAYHGGGDAVNNVLSRDPEEHRRIAPDGTFDFLNKVLGRGRDGEGSGSSASPAEDPGGGGDTPEVSGAMLRGPQSFPDSWAPMSRARNMEPGREEALMRSQDPSAGPSSSYGNDDAGWQRPAPPPASPLTNVPAATAGMERAIGAQRGQPPVPPPPSGDRMFPSVDIPRPEEVRSAAPGVGRQPDGQPAPGQPPTLDRSGGVTTRWNPQPGATEDILREHNRGGGAPPPWFSQARGLGEPNYNLNLNAPPPGPPVDDTNWQRPMPPPAPPLDDTGWQRPVPPADQVGPAQMIVQRADQQRLETDPAYREEIKQQVLAELRRQDQERAAQRVPSDDTNWQRPMPPPELSGQGGALQPAPVEPHTPEDTRPTQTPAPPDTSGGYAVGGAIGSGVRQYAGQPAVPPDQQAPAATTGSGAPPAPRGPAPGQAIGTDSMASQLNQQELARVQGGRPDIAPTGPTQAPAPTSTAAADAARDARAPATPESVERMRVRAEKDPEYARELGAQVTANTESSNPALVAARASAAQAPAEPGAYTAIGDSLAAHVIRKGGVRGKEDATKVGSYREGDTAVSGWGTQKVLELIDKIPLGQIKDQNVVLSTGASNSPADLAAIPKQIARLKELGAKSVSVLGVGTRPDFAGVNDKLAGFVAGAKDPSVVFAGALPNVGADKVHSTDPTSVFRSAQQALSKAGGGGPATATTGSGAAPTPTTALSAGGDGAATGMPAAQLPAGAPRALAPPGSASTATSAPPIDRLKGSPTAMTATGVVRAAAQGGSDGVLTYMTRNAPRGMSVGDGWNHTLDLLSQAMILKGDMNGLQHAQEYVFRMQHKGAMENLMQAIGNMTDDPNAAAHFLAKSHAYVTDGTQVGFQVLNGQIFGQRYDEQTHDKIGKPFQVTEAGLRMQAYANSDPKNFAANLHNERTTNETGRHNLKTEKHADEQLAQQGQISERSLKEKQIEFDINQKRLDEAAAQRKVDKERDDERARTLQKERLQEQADQRERDRQSRQDIADAASRERAERDAERRAEAERVRLEREHANAQQRADAAAEKDRTQLKIVNEDLADIGPQIKETYKDPAAANKARQMYTGMRTYNPTIDHETAQDYMQGLMTNKYSLSEAEPEAGTKAKGEEEWVYVRDKAGNELARVPRRVWSPYLPSRTEPSSSTRPSPRAPR